MFIASECYVDSSGKESDCEIHHDFSFELILHPTRLESPKLVLSSYIRTDFDTMASVHYHKSSPPCLNSITLAEVEQSQFFRQATLDALVVVCDAISHEALQTITNR